MILAAAQPLLADITQIVLGSVALLFLVIHQLLEANKPAGPQRGRPAVPPPPPRVADKPRPPRDTAKPRRRQSVAEHVAEQVTSRTRDLAAKAAQLGQRIVAEDQQFDVQIKATFDHTVGTLAGSAVPAAAE